MRIEDFEKAFKIDDSIQDTKIFLPFIDKCIKCYLDTNILNASLSFTHDNKTMILKIINNNVSFTIYDDLDSDSIIEKSDEKEIIDVIIKVLELTKNKIELKQKKLIKEFDEI